MKPQTARKPPAALLCKGCGCSFERVGRMAREYCSDVCRASNKAACRKGPKITPTCARCTCEFVRRSSRQKFCLECTPQARRDYTRAYNETNRELVRECRRVDMAKRAQQNPLRKAEIDRAYRDRHKIRLNAARRTDEYRNKTAARLRALHERSPRFRVHVRMASAIYQAIKAGKAGRKWEELVGYTLGDLVSHLERQFCRGMTWGNMGDWHIDHIVPKSSFEYASASDQGFRDAWALTNLRPLWAEENQRKHAKRLHLI